jgi:hypothetical protein
MSNYNISIVTALILTLSFIVINVNDMNFSINTYGSLTNNGGWQDTFNLENCDLSPSGANDYFILEPGYQLILEGQEDGEDIQLKITVLDETKTVNGTEAGIVEEIETEGGEVVEISRNWFVVCKPSNDIFYLGEEVDIYEDGKIVDHEGAWEAGVNDARHGLIMSGTPEIGMKYYQEIAPGVAEDRAEIVALDKTLDTPVGKFEKVLETEETNALKPGEKESKFYAPGIGLIQEESLMLVKHGNVTSS